MLESSGVVLFKDASANKGGVTSSSLEVLVSLALDDAQFSEWMCVSDKESPPAFYTQYVSDVHKIIENNARLEFECIWKEHERTGTPRSVLCDDLSNKINALNESLRESSLWDNVELRRKVIARACPDSLIEAVGMEAFFERVPLSYCKAIFGAHLASVFIYQYGLSTPEFAFFDFMEHYCKEDDQ